MKHFLTNFLRMGSTASTPPIRSAMRSILLVLGLFLSVSMWGADPEPEVFSFSSGATMPQGVVNSGGVAFATSCFCFDSQNDNIVITPTIPANTASISVVVKGFMNSTSASAGTIGIYGLSNNNSPVEGASGTYTQSKGSGSNASACATAAKDEETISFPATGVSKIKINCDTYSKKYVILSVTITYETSGESGTPESTVSAEPNDESYGSVSVSGTTITANPNEGYRVKSGVEGYTINAGNPTSVTNNEDNTFTVSTTEDCTIQINFEAIPQYDVTWNVNGETSTTKVYDGEKPVFPANPASCDATSTTFIGWSTAPWDDKIPNLNEKTVYTSADAMPAVTGVVTYYAVFAKVAGESGWIETAIGDLGASDVFVIVGDNGSTFAMTNDNGTSSAPGASSVTIADSKISGAVADNIKWNISGNATDGYTFYPNGDSEKWLYCTNTNNGVRVGTNENKTFTIVDEYLKHSGTSRYVGIYNSQDWRCYTSTDGNIADQTFNFYKYSAGTASDYMTTCCTKYNVTIADGIANGSVSADPTSACEDETVTLTFTPDLNYHLKSWSLNGVNQDVDENTFVMPAGNVEVNAVFAQDACTPLATPANVAKSGLDYPYTVQLTWDEVANADKYTVYILTNEDVEVEHGDVTDEEYTVTASLAASTTYKYTIQAISNTPATYCPSALAQGTFSTEALPTAKLTLIDLGEERAETGEHAILTAFNLPETGSTCSKAFYGWTADENYSSENVAPEYAAGGEFTFTNTTDVTLYAVYADVTGGGTSTTNIAYTNTETTTNMTGENEAATFGLDADEWSVVGAKGGNSNNVGLNKAKDIRLYYHENGGNTLTITAPQTITSIALTFTEDSYKNAWVKVAGETVTLTDGVYPINNTTFVIGNANTSNVQVRISNIAVNFATAGTASNYSTTCAAAPVAIVNPAEVNAPAAGVANGIIEIDYDNVNKENVTVASNSAWLTVSLNDDKNIVYTIAENTSYKDAREASISLTAPETNGATDPAVVVIPVNQAKKDAVFSSLEDLVAANLASGTEVTVSFSNILITEVYTTNAGYRYGLYLNVKDKDGENDIELFYNKQSDSEQVPDTWLKNGYVSATNLVATWTEYKGQWELAMQGANWTWDNGDITYAAPKAVLSVVVSGEPDKKAYVDGEKFNPAGLTVTVNYTVGNPEVIAATDADWVYETSNILALNQTSIKVKATYNSVTSEEFYHVTGLTVGEIPTKTVQEFITAGNADMRCYLEGTVSDIETGNKLKYGNFNLTDASGTIYVYGCLDADGNAEQFATLGVNNGDKIKVIAEDYEYYNNKHEAKNVQFVSKVSPVRITIANKTLEVGQNWNIEATTDPEGAVNNISYDIKDDGSNAFVSLDGKEITANAVGTATIIASIPAGEGYLANEIEFEVEVVEAGTIADVVILVQYDGKYLAMTDELTAVKVDYQDGKLLDVAVADQAKIVWTRTIAEGKATFSIDGKYLKGASGNTGLQVAEGADGSYQWDWKEEGYYELSTKVGRTFFYQETSGAFKNYSVSSNAGKTGYSTVPTFVAAPQFLTRAELRGGLSEGKWGTYCPDHSVKYVEGASFYTLTYLQMAGEMPYKLFFDEIESNYLEAGKPYLFIAEGEAIKGVKVGDAAGVAANYNGFYGNVGGSTIQISTSQNAYKADEDVVNYYGLTNNTFTLLANGTNVAHERAVVQIKNGQLDCANPPHSLPAPRAGARRVVAGNNAPAVATGMDELNASETPVKVMIDGQLFILRGEKMYNANGQLVK